LVFLSKAELDYLTAKRQFSTDYAYTIKSRLQHKLKFFASQELPLLVEKGYLTEFGKLTENCKGFNNVNNALSANAPQYSYEPLQGVCTG